MPARPIVSFSGAVLAGGRSARMGRDKAFVEVGGRPLAAVARDALVGAGAGEVLAVGGDRAGLVALGFAHVADAYPDAGPLGGIVTALRAARHEIVVVLACDLPHVVPAAVDALLAALTADDGADAAVPEVAGRPEVLLAAYRRTCREPFATALAAGERAPKRAIAGLDVRRVALADPGWATNANRPEDLPV